MSDESDRIEQAAAPIAAAAESLSEKFTAILERTTEAEKSIRRSKLAIKWAWATIVLDLVLSVGMVVGYFEQRNFNQRLSQNDQEIEIVRHDALCPFYSLIIGSYNPNSRAPGVSREIYDQNFAAMRAQRDVLNCTDPLVPPPTSYPQPPR